MRHLAVILMVTAVGVSLAAPAEAAGAVDRSIVVVDVDGLLDPVSADLVADSLAEAEARGVALMIVALDSSVDVDVDVDALVERIEGSSRPVVAWVKGGGAARAGAARLVRAAHLAAVGSDSRLEFDGRDLSATEAVSAGAADFVAPTLRDLVALLDGRRVSVAGKTTTLSLGETIPGGEGEDEKQVFPIRFRELDLTDQLQHALTSPFVAYLLLVVGLCLGVFEFFAVGIGVAAMVGAVLVAASFVGFTHLPVDPVSFGMVVGGILLVSIDVQAGSARFWATVGGLSLLVGSLRLYDGPARLDPPWWQVVVVVAAALVFLLPGLAAVIRARFSTPTIGREWMVGEEGVAQVAFDPEGVVTVRGAPWRARATRAATSAARVARAADVAAGDVVRVASVMGLMLEVEPVEAPADAPADREPDTPDSPAD